MVGPTHYQLLRVEPDASREQLRQAFRSLSKRFHPDTTDLPAADAERAFRQLQQAYAVLSDPISRERYDSELSRQKPAEASPGPLRRMPSPEVRRDLSGGEWLALLLLGLALMFSLVLGVGLALARGTALVQWPSWWGSPDPVVTLVPGVSSPSP
ncbi:MAG: DnaJ domain-containing protein [Cyanobacteriota bacterium]|nr:DnaJ domain-containing protein [Cyanobacteriota bacterium]